MSVFCVPRAIITARNSAAVSYSADTCTDRGGSRLGGGGGEGGGAPHTDSGAIRSVMYRVCSAYRYSYLPGVVCGWLIDARAVTQTVS